MEQEQQVLRNSNMKQEKLFRETIAALAHKNAELHRIIREIWSIVGERDYGCEDTELPAVVQGYVVGLQRLQASLPKYGLVMKSDYGFKPSETKPE
jgi:hypothetical protein